MEFLYDLLEQIDYFFEMIVAFFESMRESLYDIFGTFEGEE